VLGPLRFWASFHVAENIMMGNNPMKSVTLHGFETGDTQNITTGQTDGATQLNITRSTTATFIIPFRDGKPFGNDAFLVDTVVDNQTALFEYLTHIGVDVGGEVVPTPPPTPEEIRSSLPDLSRKQFRLGMRDLGVTSAMINAAIAAIEDDDQREIAQIEWEDSASYARMHPLIAQLAGAFGKTDAEIDAVWVMAATYA
jgi:hypothetical protein